MVVNCKQIQSLKKSLQRLIGMRKCSCISVCMFFCQMFFSWVIHIFFQRVQSKNWNRILYFFKTKIMLSMSPHAFWTLFVFSVSSFISFPPHCPFFSLFTPYIYLSANTVSSIFLPSHPSFCSLPPFPFCSCIFLHAPSHHSCCFLLDHSLDSLPLILHSLFAPNTVLLLYSLCSLRLDTSSNSPIWCILHTHVTFLSLLYYLWPFSLILIAQWHLFVWFGVLYTALLFNWKFRNIPLFGFILKPLAFCNSVLNSSDILAVAIQYMIVRFTISSLKIRKIKINSTEPNTLSVLLNTFGWTFR